jgi:hypothetical protein
MAWTDSQNNSKDKNYNDDINTRGITMYNKEGFDPSCMEIGYWNSNFVTLTISPALPADKQSKSKVYDYDAKVKATFSPQVAEMIAFSMEKLIPEIEAGNARSIGIQFGASGDNMIVVGTGVDKTNSVRPYIAICKGIDASTRRPELAIFYEFNKGTIIDNYNAETGKYEGVSNIHSEYNMFINILRDVAKALSNADVHAFRCVQRAYNTKLMDSVVAIGNKVGADIPSKSFTPREKVDFTSSNNGDDDAPPFNIDDISNLMNME